MEKKRSGRHWFWRLNSHLWSALGMMALLVLMPSGSALGQTIAVTGTVTSSAGAPLRGVAVSVQGTDTRTFTNATGRYSIAAPSNGILSFTLIGQRATTANVGGRSTIDVRMEPIAFLEEVVVTAYSEEQRRGEVTGAISTVNLGTVERQTGASVLQRLDASVTGVTVNASGNPGSRSTVRIRGVSSFQNNDPLYVVDGTPVNDDYVNWLNPADIASIQVLKDASAASIYGSRASNGVIIIETLKRGAGGPPRVTFSARTGVASPVRGYDDFLILNSLDYFQIVKRSYENAGQPVPTNIYGSATNPTVPQYIWPNNCGPLGSDGAPTPGACTNVNLNSYAYPNTLIMPGSQGTNWWKAVFHPAQLQDYNLSVSGGNEDNAYAVSFNYFNQDGTARYNNFKRGSVRANTSFNRGKLNFGENIALSLDRHVGGIADDSFGEGSFLGKNILSQPIVPIYDVQGNFASGKAVGLGNNSNPLKEAWVHRNDQNSNNRIFGNVFAGYAVMPELSLRTKFGFNVGQGSFVGFTPIYPENSEPSFQNTLNENQSTFTDWTWSNTAKYERRFDKHAVSVLVGQEANAATNRLLASSINGLLKTDPEYRYVQDALGDASTKNTTSSGGRSALLSFFGKADYNWDEKYVASFTLRQDGSSRLGPTHRWGTFPAIGLGWRISKESFLAGNSIFSDVMLRYGWGVTGNQAIPAGRIVSQYGGDRGDTFYDVGGTNTSIQPGFRQRSLGNADLKWEENRSQNIGADLGLFNGQINVVVDLYSRNTNNLLFDPPLPATAGVTDPPIVNIGKMQNKGIDFSIGHQTATWSLFFNGSHYKNKIVSIDGVSDFFYGPISTRYGNQVINKVGQPIGAFYGLVADGFFSSPADAAAHAPGAGGTCATPPCQDGAAQGRIRFKDTNRDGKITLEDRTIIGSPHPDFTAGMDLGYRRGSWDIAATVFGTFGNDIFDVQKEFYVFRNFSTNVRKDLLTDSWTPTHTNAKYPILDINDNYSHAISSFYVENGSYVRLRTLQVGYNVPQRFSRWLAASRVYVQAENLFTITGYDGLDPALPAANVFGPAGDIRDQYRGVDRGTYPSNRTFSIGLVTNF